MHGLKIGFEFHVMMHQTDNFLRVSGNLCRCTVITYDPYNSVVFSWLLHTSISCQANLTAIENKSNHFMDAHSRIYYSKHWLQSKRKKKKEKKKNNKEELMSYRAMLNHYCFPFSSISWFHSMQVNHFRGIPEEKINNTWKRNDTSRVCARAYTHT